MNQDLRTYLVIDNSLVSERHNVHLELGRVDKSNSNPLFVEEFFGDPPKRWEARYDNLYPNVVYDQNKGSFKLWYNAFIRAGQSEETPLDERPHNAYHGGKTEDGVMYASSEDGLTWVKPDLGLIEFDGSTANNIVMTTGTHGAHGTGVLEDLLDPDASRRFKALFKNPVSRRMEVAFSADGLQWSESVPWAEYSAVGDTHNNAIRDATGRYVAVTRGWTGDEVDNGIRTAMRTESLDFVNWTDPEVIMQGQGLHDQIYSMPIFQIGPTYLGLPAIFHKGDPEADDWDTVDTELAWSHDSIDWTRIAAGEPFIPRGEGKYPNGAYDCGCVYAAAPVLVGDTHYLYYGGSNGQHNNFREGNLSLATIPRNRFAGYVAGGVDGQLTTTPLIWGVGGVTINAIVRAGGVIRAAVIDEVGSELEDFGFEDCEPIRQDSLESPLLWQQNTAQLAGRSLSLKFEFREATIYDFTGPFDLADH